MHKHIHCLHAYRIKTCVVHQRKSWYQITLHYSGAIEPRKVKFGIYIIQKNFLGYGENPVLISIKIKELETIEKEQTMVFSEVENVYTSFCFS